MAIICEMKQSLGFLKVFAVDFFGGDDCFVLVFFFKKNIFWFGVFV